jgi:hypothetical protein
MSDSNPIPPDFKVYTQDLNSTNTLNIRLGNGGCIIKPDGTFETYGEYTPDEAARAFWGAVARQKPDI